MKTLSKIEISKQTPQKYQSVDAFIAAKLQTATESLKKVDLSLLRK